nr:transmembrane protein 42 [Halyomorpha halys]
MKNILRNRHIFFKDAVFLHYSVIGGVFSSIGSMFGKLSSSIEGIFLLTVLLFILMIGFNTMGMLFFAKGLHTAPSSIHATLISSASNYVSTAIIGSLLFGERTPFMWWFGTSFVIAGVVVTSYSQQNSHQGVD